MKKLIVLLAILILFGGITVHAQEDPNIDAIDVGGDQTVSTEKIISMDVQAAIHTDASVSVTESIQYDFGGLSKHGIYRTIPLGFMAKGEPGHTEIVVKGVTDEAGNAYPYKITTNDPVNVKIGDADKALTGIHTYKISYLLRRSIGYFENYDEWYWNLTGNDWEVPIGKVTATVTVPADVPEGGFRFSDYCGFAGDVKSCGNFFVMNGKTVTYATNPSRTFEAGEGVTIGVGFPKGMAAVPSQSEFFWAWLARVWFIPFPFLFAYLWFRKRFAYMWKRSKYYRANTIIAEYDPGEFNPMEAGILVNGGSTNKDISAAIVALAIEGHIKIEEKDGEFCFKKKKELPTNASKSEGHIFKAIKDVCESDFGDDQADEFSKALEGAGSRLLARDYVEKSGKFNLSGTAFVVGVSPHSIVKVILPLFLAVNPGIFIWFFLGSAAGFMFSGTCVLIAFINVFLKSMAVYLTEKGFEAERHLLGLKLYIKVAEEDRIKFANAPAKTPELFEKLLPYAMIFGLEKKWAKEFEGFYKTNPSWYSGSSIHTFSTLALIGSMQSLQTSADRAIASSVKSSSSSSWSSSSGGSSGGGSSGGGGGGGGGGSW